MGGSEARRVATYAARDAICAWHKLVYHIQKSTPEFGAVARKFRCGLQLMGLKGTTLLDLISTLAHNALSPFLKKTSITFGPLSLLCSTRSA